MSIPHLGREGNPCCVSRPTARLIGTRYTPRLELRFSSGSALPKGVRVPYSPLDGLPPVNDPPTYLDWVRRLPGRVWDNDRKCWVAWDLGEDPDGVLAHAGFDVDLSRAVAAGFNSLADLASLSIQLDKDDPRTTYIYQRMVTREDLESFLPTGAKYDTKAFRWVVQTMDLHDSQLGLPMAVKKALSTLRPPEAVVVPGARELASAASFAELDSDAHAKLVAEHGPIPSWFGLELYGYQHVGIYSVLSGHNSLCDSPGLGKTRQALGALAVNGGDRTVIVVPPVVLTNWKREVMQANLAGAVPPKVLKKDRGKPVLDPLAGLSDDEIGRRRTHTVVLWSPSRKIPALPERGIVIVPDSLITARPELRKELAAWKPDSFIVDEVHRTMNWDSARSGAVRDMAYKCSGLKVTISGTPMFASPSDLCSSLAITGHLDSVFGGLSKFLDTYTTKNRFGKYQARKRSLPELRRLLMEHVWTRRTKGQVLPDLPKKSRHPLHLDLDLKEFRKAHDEVKEIISEWLKEYPAKHKGNMPDVPDIEKFAQDNLYLVTLLRRAAGMTKIPAAADIIREHVLSTTEEGSDGHKIYTRPLLVWTHHKDVTKAMVDALPPDVGTTAAIFGETAPEKRGEIVDDFQAGRTSVLVASISAASVGITLTRGCDAIFVETDWSPQQVTQAEDRLCRIGQTRPVTLTTLIAEGTLDLQVQRAQQKKIEVLSEVLTGDDIFVSVVDQISADEQSESMKIIKRMVIDLMACR